MTTDECMNVLTGLERQLAKEVGAGANKTIEVEFASHHGEPVVNSYKVSGPRSALPASISAAANLALFGSEDTNEPVILSADVVEPAQATATGAAATNPETTEPKESLILEPEVKPVEIEAKNSSKSKKTTKATELVAVDESQVVTAATAVEPNVFVFGDSVVRTARTDAGEPLFCLADICKVLDASQPNKVAESIREEFELTELNSGSFDTGFGVKEFTLVTEPQLYFVLYRSRSSLAKPFRRWVDSEVLPSIRESKVTSTALIDVHMQDGHAVTTSRNIAEVFGKEHKNVIRDIRAIIDGNPDKEFGRLNFEPTSYKDQWGREQAEYALTRDGTMLLIMGYTGAKAMALKTAYIKRFNEMEQALRNGTQVQHQVGYSPRELLDAAELIYQSAGLEGNQLTLALDKANTALTGKSLLALGEVQLKAPTQERLLNPTELGKPLGLSPRTVNSRLQAKGFQIKGVAGWELTATGKALGGVYLDTGKKHSSGVPVRQIKWPATVATEL